MSSLPFSDYERLKEAILKLAENPRPTGCKKLIGREGWRIRVGNYRVIYEIIYEINDDREKKVLILHIGHRKDVYR